MSQDYHVSEAILSTLVAGLEQLGYRGAQLERDYSFPDFFAGQETRTLSAAAFAQTPASYETACIGVVKANGVAGLPLVNSLRGFGAPVLLEIDGNGVKEWAVSRIEDKHILLGRHSASQIQMLIEHRASDWRPEALIRAKNIGTFKWEEQLNLFSGLIPELEDRIQASLDPLLRETLSRTTETFIESARRTPDPRHLFQLVFWILTAKVFRDRGVPGFADLDDDPDAILTAVAAHYGKAVPRMLNQNARITAAQSVWRELDFRNLSVEVLAHIWSKTLVDSATRKRLGIHRTPRAIVRYIVERLPFPTGGDEDLIVFEPCSGSAAFLIGAVNQLRPHLPLASSQERHGYFLKHLAGLELDAFGVEISTLALTLADFPNANGWNVTQGDVFQPNTMSSFLRKAGAVLCNPPFEAFTEQERESYEAKDIRKPAELLRRVLADLHPAGVLGFVLPYTAVDGKPYADTRRMLATRFASLDFTVLPDRSFEHAESEIAVLIAKEPIPHSATMVSFHRVNDWDKFRQDQTVSTSYNANFTADTARRGITLSDLAEVWSFLSSHRQLADIAEIHRGIEWRSKINPQMHLRDKAAPRYVLGVPPKAKFNAFQTPQLKYLSIEPDEQRTKAWQFEWSKPKAIVPKTRVSRGHWRMVAFADRQGLCCYQTFCGVWPKTGEYDEITLAAILNSPVANAFVASREGTRDTTLEVLKLIPVPKFSRVAVGQLHELVRRYEECVNTIVLDRHDDPETLLKQIDAMVLEAYHMPPRIERALLDYFNGSARKVDHPFHDYFPASLDIFVHLREYLGDKFARSTVGELLKKSHFQ